MRKLILFSEDRVYAADERAFFTLDDIAMRAGKNLREPLLFAIVPAAVGRVLATDTNNHRVLLFDPESRTYCTWAA